jgi:uncharacterized membrane protein
MSNDATAGSGRNLRLALTASLALNILIVGGVAAAFVLPHLHGWKGHPKPGSLAGFAETLPPDRAEIVRQKVRGEKANFEALSKEERESREAARVILTEDPFDVAKFKAALDHVAQALDKQTRARMTLVADTAAELTPEERKQLHAYFEKHRPHRHHPPDDQPKPGE